MFLFGGEGGGWQKRGDISISINHLSSNLLGRRKALTTRIKHLFNHQHNGESF